MDCKQAEEFIMSYMDNTLSEKDAHKLNEHLKTCDECRESFEMYEKMMKEFEKETELVEAPVGFEESIMIRIKDISPEYLTHKKLSIETIQAFVWGTFTILLGIGVMLNVYKDVLKEYIAQNAAMASFYDAVTPISDVVTQYITEAIAFVQTTLGNMSGIIVYSQIIAAVLIVVMCVVQFWAKKSKVDV